MADLESGKFLSSTPSLATVVQDSASRKFLSSSTSVVTVVQDSASEKPSSPEDNASSQSAEDNFPEGGSRAWLTVAGSFLVQYATFGYVNSFGVYQDYYVRVYLTNYTPSEIGWIGGAQIFFIFSTGIFTGLTMDRGYFHQLMIASTIMQALALFTLSAVQQNQYYQIFLAQSVCLGLSCGLVLIPSLSIVSHYFQKNRPLALGIVAAGSGLGAVLNPIMLNKLFSGSVGFHNGIRASGALNTTLLVIANFMMRTRLPPKKAAKLPLKEVFLDPAYVSLAFGSVLIFFGLFYPTFQIQLNAIVHGIDPDYAFYLLSIMNAASVFGRALPPLLAQRVGVMNLLIFFTAASGVVVCTMSLIDDLVGTTVFSVAYGFFSGGIISLTPSAVGMMSRSVSEIGARLGILYALGGIVGLCASPIQGALLTDSLNWMRASLFAGIMLIVATFCGIASRWFLVKRNGTQFV